MSSVAVVTDSSAYLPGSVLSEEGIEVVSLYVEFADGRVERESDMADFAAFYEQLPREKELPRTAPAKTQDFIQTYRRLLEDRGHVVSIHISSGLSQTCSAAREAAERVGSQGAGGERVRVIDSASAVGGLGLVALAAARAARAGAGIEEVVDRARHAREAQRLWFVVDTLEFLRRGGRIGGAAAWFGSTLAIKPILTVESEIERVERVRTRARAFERMIEYARERQAAGASGWFVQHTRAEGDANKLVERCEEVFRRPPEFMSEVGPVIGTHSGPGVLGFGALPVNLLE